MMYKACLKRNVTGVIINQIHGFTFKVIPFESNAFPHPCLISFLALLEKFFWDSPQLLQSEHLDYRHAFKLQIYSCKWCVQEK